MTHIALATQSPEFEARFHVATEGAYLRLPEGRLPSEPRQLVGLLQGAPLPDVLVIDPGPEADAALSLTARLREELPGIAVLIVTTAEHEIGLAALRAGVRDVIHPLSDTSSIQAALDRASARPFDAEEHLDAISAKSTQRVISVVSPKGGVGKTTVATNLAVGLAKNAPGSTVLVDLDVQFGDVATALNLTPEYSLLDTVRGPASRDTMALKTFLTLHETQLYTICAPESPAAGDVISGDEITRLLEMLSSQFQHVVVDTAPGLSEHTLAAMDRTTDLVLLTSMDVLGVRGLRKELDILSELNMRPETQTVVINFCERRGGLTMSDVTATIGAPVDHELPVSPLVLQSLNQGIPLIQSGGRDPMTKKLDNLVGRFATAEASAGTGRRRSRSGRPKRARAL